MSTPKAKRASKREAAEPRVVPNDLREIVTEAFRTLSSVGATQLKKALPPSHQPFHREALELVRGLAHRGELHRWTNGKRSEIFFAHDPFATLDRIVPKQLGSVSLNKTQLKSLVAKEASGHDPLLDEWLTSALKRGLLFAHGKKTPRFFARAPFATLDRIVLEKLGNTLLNKAELAAQVTREAPGHEPLLDEWLANALKRGALFKYSNDQYGSEPDVRTALKSVFAALTKALAKDSMKVVSKRHIANAVLTELGLPPLETVGSPPTRTNGSRPSDMRDSFLAALHRLVSQTPNQSLISVHELRAGLDMGKERFDEIALELARDGFVSLHHHDHPNSLSESERNQLIRDARGTHYIAIALRSV